MRVRLLMDWAGPDHPFSPAGATVEVDVATAQQLFRSGAAEPVMEEPEVAVIPEPRKAARTKRGKR